VDHGGAAGGWDFFVSYAQSDRTWAEWAAWTLEEAGYRVLIQAWDLPGGSNWVAGLDAGVARADRTLVMLSDDYAHSVYEQAEWRAAWVEDPAGRQRKLLVARVVDCPRPGLLAQLVSLDLFGVVETVARERLLGAAGLAVSGGRGKPDSAPPFPPAARAVPTRAGFPGETPGSVRVRPPAALLPDLPTRFVPRPVELARLRRVLLGSAGGTVIGLVGMGGAGKSTLARTVIHDAEVRNGFPDGIVWVEVNPEPDVAAVLGAVLSAFGDPAPVLTVPDAAVRLRRLLAGAACLIVLDNVWEPEILRALPLAGRARVLVTARNKDALFTDSEIFEIPAVDDATARRLLAAYAGCGTDELPAVSRQVLDRCGGLVLAVALVGGMVRGGTPWANVAERLRRADLRRLAGRFADYPHPDLLAALEVSVTALDGAAAARFRELAVFAGRGSVPAQVVTELWQATGGLDDLDADDLLRMLARRSLVHVDAATDTVTLHDLLFDYARSALPDGQLTVLHRRLAESFLDGWGGLSAGLPGLRDRLEFAEPDRHRIGMLITHLLASGAHDVVDAVLAAEWPRAGSVDNAWHLVRERLGETGEYLADLRAINADIDRQATGATTAARYADCVARRFHYSLVAASISSIAANVPPELLTRLLVDGLWAAPQVLAYALAIPGQESRADALTRLAPHLPADLVTRAMDAAWTIGTPGSRLKALIGLAPFAPEDRRAQVRQTALETVLAIDDQSDRVEALATLAALAPDLLGEQAVRAARDTAFAADSPADVAELLGELAEHAPPSHRAAAAQAGLDVARTIDDPLMRAKALAVFSNSLPGERAERAVAEAVAAAASITDPAGRVEALSSVTDLVPDGCVDQVLDALLAAADGVDDRAERARMLTGLTADGVSTGGVARLIGALLACFDDPADLAALLAEEAELRTTEGIVTTIRDVRRSLLALEPPMRADERRGPSRQPPFTVLSSALEAAVALDDPSLRAAVFTELAPGLPPDRREPALRAAWGAVRALRALNDDLPEPIEAASAVTALITRAPRENREPLIDAALEAVEALADPVDHGKALLGLVTALEPDDQRHDLVIAAIFDVALAIDDAAQQIRVLTQLAPVLPHARREVAIETALTVASEIEGTPHWLELMAKITPFLPTRLLLTAFLMATGIDGPTADNLPLAKIARNRPDPEHTFLVRRLVEQIAGLGWRDERFDALQDLTEELAAAEITRVTGLSRTLDNLPTIVDVFGSELMRAVADSGAAATRTGEESATDGAVVDADRAGEAMDEGAPAPAALDPGRPRADDDEALTQALRRFLGVFEEPTEPENYSWLAWDCPTLVFETFETVIHITDPSDREAVLAELVNDISADRREAALDSWAAIRPLLGLAGDPIDAEVRGRLLVGLVRRVPVDRRAALVRAALAAVRLVDDAAERAELLTELVPWATVDYQGTILDDFLSFAEEMDEVWVSTSLIHRLLENTAEDRRRSVLAALMATFAAFELPARRATAYLGLMRYLPADLRGRAVHAAATAALDTDAQEAPLIAAAARAGLDLDVRALLEIVPTVALPDGRAELLSWLTVVLPSACAEPLARAALAALMDLEPDDQVELLAKTLPLAAPPQQRLVLVALLDQAAAAGRGVLLNDALPAVLEVVPARETLMSAVRSIEQAHAWWP
jgi:hypothetical protein